jgi:hypothetical protein
VLSPRLSWRRLTLAALVLLVAPACRRIAPRLTPALPLTPAAEARANLVAEFLLASPQRTLATVGAVSKKLALPFGEPELRRFLLARSGASEALIGRVDLDKPVSAIVVAAPPGDAGAANGPLVAAAFTLRDPSPAGFDAFVGAAGRPGEHVQDAVHLQRGDGGGPGPFWLLPREGAVCAADSVPALTAACALALESRQARGEDLRIAVFPDGVARASGTTLKAALAKFRQEVATQRSAAMAGIANTTPPGLAAAGGELAESIVGIGLDAVADTQEVRTALGLRAETGLTTTFEVVPRKGSSLARIVSDRRPYAVDPALLVGPPPGALWAMGDIGLSSQLFQAVRGPILDAVVPEPERARVTANVEALFAGVAGPWSARFSYVTAPKLTLQYDIVYTLAAGTDGKKLLAAMEELVKGPWMARLMAAAFKGMMKVKVETRREGETVVTRMSFDTKKLPASVKSELKGLPFLDGTPIESRAAVTGTRLLVSVGPESKVRLAALMATRIAPTPSPDLTAALEETRSSDGLYYADLAALLRPALGFAAQSARAGAGSANANAMIGMAGALLENAHLATWGSYRGGPTFTLTGRIPMTTFESVAALARSAMGLGGAR